MHLVETFCISLARSVAMTRLGPEPLDLGQAVQGSSDDWRGRSRRADVNIDKPFAPSSCRRLSKRVRQWSETSSTTP